MLCYSFLIAKSQLLFANKTPKTTHFECVTYYQRVVLHESFLTNIAAFMPVYQQPCSFAPSQSSAIVLDSYVIQKQAKSWNKGFLMICLQVTTQQAMLLLQMRCSSQATSGTFLAHVSSKNFHWLPGNPMVIMKKLR